MFLGNFDSGKNTLLFESDIHSSVQFKDKNVQCSFFGEMMSSKKDATLAYRKFLKNNNSKDILFLKGNYQTVIHIEDTLFLFSDIANCRPIYYTELGNKLIFSSNLHFIQDKLPSQLNHHHLSKQLLTGGLHIDGETPYQKIKKIAGGYGLVVKNGSTRLFRAWIIDDDPPLSLEEGQYLLKKQLIEAVLYRSKNRQVTSDLSGGLDSSTLAWIASNDKEIRTITFVGKEENEDAFIARKIIELRGNIIPDFIGYDNIPPNYSNIESFHTDSPIPFLWSASKFRSKLRWAKENESDIHFCGEGADTVIEPSLTYLIDLLKQKKLFMFWDHTREWARKFNESPWNWMNISMRLALNINTPKNMKKRHSLLLDPVHIDWLKKQEGIIQNKHSKYRGVSDTLRGIYYLGYVSHGLRELSVQEGVNLAMPYLDHNIIRTCMRIKSEDKMNPQMLKPLLKKSFQDDLPNCLLNRNTKGNYTADLYHGVRIHQNWFENNFKSMILSDIGLVNLSKFQECIQKLLLGLPVRLPEFNQTLAVEMWLRQENMRGRL
ncbi:hypothetical protein IC620_16610 [Hazenella sp. IB182357]|uniref:asparagine synthase (glutamine-hydrolyzing) n=1 Tax=Polycladospora coralii TaxID=2771432 RepID=A0A926RYZ2_9BACL|nr:asparagine synthase-related protein [Polycladospora coralii]MBD1373966.1 hypothetical protein [Polycladospora coralii]MBS7529534.1 hypothetical protein [Polycladospora coralii]